MFKLFVIVVTFYLILRGWQTLPGIYSRAVYAISVSIVLLFLASVVINHFFHDEIPVYAKDYYSLIKSSFLLFFYWFLIAVIIVDSLRIFDHFFSIFPLWITSNYSKVKLIYFFIVVSVPLIFFTVGFKGYSSDPKIVELDLSYSSGSLVEGDFSIVAAGDFHLGPLSGSIKLAEWINLINKEIPDIILLVGDIFDYRFNPDESEEVINELKKLKARYGVYAVPGNHEYYFNINLSLEYLERAGIKVLRDELITIDDKITLVGRDDAYNKNRLSLDSLIAEADTEMPLVILDHQPVDISSAVTNAIDLQISGHTHNGQIFPVNYLALLKWDIVYGYHRIGNSDFYVTSGIGSSFIPIRIGTQTEIVKITMKNKTVL